MTETELNWVIKHLRELQEQIDTLKEQVKELEEKGEKKKSQKEAEEIIEAYKRMIRGEARQC